MHGDPVLAEARSTSRLVRLLLRESGHSEIMARWGRVWVWHGGLFFAFFLLTDLLLVARIRALGPYVALWSVGLAGLIGVVWYHRIRGGLRLMPIERQVAQVWVLFSLGCVLTALINHVTGRDISGLLPLVVVQCGLACGCTATILGGTFYIMAIVCAVLAVVMALAPGAGAAAFGLAFSAGLLVTGLRIPGRRVRRPRAPARRGTRGDRSPHQVP